MLHHNHISKADVFYLLYLKLITSTWYHRGIILRGLSCHYFVVEFPGVWECTNSYIGNSFCWTHLAAAGSFMGCTSVLDFSMHRWCTWVCVSIPNSSIAVSAFLDMSAVKIIMHRILVRFYTFLVCFVSVSSDRRQGSHFSLQPLSPLFSILTLSTFFVLTCSLLLFSIQSVHCQLYSSISKLFVPATSLFLLFVQSMLCGPIQTSPMFSDVIPIALWCSIGALSTSSRGADILCSDVVPFLLCSVNALPTLFRQCQLSLCRSHSHCSSPFRRSLSSSLHVLEYWFVISLPRDIFVKAKAW